MDINAGFPINRSSTVNFQPNPGSASSATSSGQNPPTVQSFDRWHEMPADITFQIMQWMMLNERSRSAPASFAMTSKSFYNAGQAFRGHHLYESAQAILLHPRLVNRSRSYLDSLGYRPRFPDIENPDELISLLEYLPKNDDEPGPMQYLKLGEIPETTIFDSRVEQAIRAHKGKLLSVCFDGNRPANKLASHIAKTLPTSADLNFLLNSTNVVGKDIPEWIYDTCTLGHITSIQFSNCEHLTSNPEARQALLNVLCGDGLVSYAVFDVLKTNDMLKDLTARFHEIRHLRLLSILNQRNITPSDLQALVAAIQQRHASGQPRITVALDLVQSRDSTSLSKEKLLELEGLGLFLGHLDGSHSATTLLNKVRLSVGEGPIGSYINHSRFVAASEAEDSEGSDVMVELRDEVSFVRLCSDNSSEDANERSRLPLESRTGRRQPSQSNAPESTKKKRDGCVIS